MNCLPAETSAIVAAIGDGSSFGRARDLSAWLGLVPWQITTGGKLFEPTVRIAVSTRAFPYASGVPGLR